VINHILVPLDGSEQSERALDTASSVAEAYGGARVTLLAVMIRFPESRIHVPKLDEQSEDRGKAYLEEAGRRYVHRFPVDMKVRLGVPADEILAEARESHVDMIVMSTHGTAGMERDKHSIGSTAWRVLHDSPCPILLVPLSRG
jgi:nucleotide-binding universal stress UspA family protein